MELSSTDYVTSGEDLLHLGYTTIKEALESPDGVTTDDLVKKYAITARTASAVALSSSYHEYKTLLELERQRRGLESGIGELKQEESNKPHVGYYIAAALILLAIVFAFFTLIAWCIRTVIGWM